MAIQSYGDSRTLLYCAFCGGATGTRDHCPSRIFLDKPYPDDLPVVPACRECNNSFSIDEEYLACLIACVLAGTTNPENIERPSIQISLQHSAALRVRLEQARNENDGKVIYVPEIARVNNVITKLAQGHALYELHESRPTQPDAVWAVPLELLTEEQRSAFEYPDLPAVWPEVGSRAMQRMVIDGEPDYPWISVQPGMYRYLASQESGTTIHIVIQEYLAGFVQWN